MKKICALALVLLLALATLPAVSAAADDGFIDIYAYGAELSTNSRSSDPPEMAFDARPLTVFRTKTANKYNGDWIRIDFQKDVTFNCIELYESFDNVAYEYEYAVQRFMIQISEDGNDWDTIHFGEEIGVRKQVVFPTVTTKHVRLVFRGLENNRITLATIKLFHKPELEAGKGLTLFADSQKALVDGVEKQITETPFISDGKLLMPAKGFADILGYSYDWDAENKSAFIGFEQQKTEGKTYYVATDGDDTAAGTIDAPFKTINHAAQLLRPGDTCMIRGGVYRETVVPKNSGNEKNPIVYTAYPGEKVTISGAEPLNAEWELERDSVYKAQISDEIKQIFVDEKMMNSARYPNAEVNKLFEQSAYDFLEDGDYEWAVHDAFAEGDLNGAQMTIWNGEGWTSTTKTLTHVPKEKKVIFTERFPENKNDGYHLYDAYVPKAGNRFYIFGVPDLIDYPNEWAQKDGYVYLQTSDGASPANHNVEIKARTFAFDANAVDFIEVRGINLFACTFRFTASNNCTIDNCRVLYQSYGNSQNVHDRGYCYTTNLQGENNTVKNSLFAHSVGAGVHMVGKNGLVQNNVIHDVNVIGHNEASGITMLGTGMKILNNTVYNTGRDLIYYFNGRDFVISGNHLYNGGILSKDLGAIYGWKVNGPQRKEISYNVIHDMNGFVGIYMDNFCENFDIHHNVIYNNCGVGIQVNSPSINHNIVNNTILDVGLGANTASYAGYEDSHAGVLWANNIVTTTRGSNFIMQAGKAPEFKTNLEGAPGEIDINMDTFLAPASEIKDKGTVVKGINDSFVGSAPDIGAFEIGAERWTAGADWNPYE